MSDDLDKLMKQIPINHRYRWCESSGCGCKGCANVSGGLISKGFNKAEWQVWVEDNKTNLKFKKLGISDIKVGVSLYMQKEPNNQDSFFAWGAIEVGDINRLKREIKSGNNYMWIEDKAT